MAGGFQNPESKTNPHLDRVMLPYTPNRGEGVKGSARSRSVGAPVLVVQRDSIGGLH